MSLGQNNLCLRCSPRSLHHTFLNNTTCWLCELLALTLSQQRLFQGLPGFCTACMDLPQPMVVDITQHTHPAWLLCPPALFPGSEEKPGQMGKTKDLGVTGLCPPTDAV